MAKKQNSDDNDGIVGDIEDLQSPKVSNFSEAVEATIQPKEVIKSEGLVEMRKGEETLHVHASAVKSHVRAGWKVQ